MSTATTEHQPSNVINRATFSKNDDRALIWKLGEKIVQDQEHLCCFLSCAVLGVDTQLLSDKVVRGGQLVTPVPTVVTRLRGPPRPWAHTRLLDQGGSSFVLPGPATIMDGIYNN